MRSLKEPSGPRNCRGVVEVIKEKKQAAKQPITIIYVLKNLMKTDNLTCLDPVMNDRPPIN